MPASVSCTWCGNEVELTPGCGLNVQCPKCETMCGVPAHLAIAAAKIESPAPPPLPPEIDDGPGFLDEAEPEPVLETDLEPLEPRARKVDDDDDGQPYVLNAPIKRCPNCGAILDDEAVACAKCKYDLETKQVPVAKIKPVQRTWEAGWPLATRVKAFILYETGLIILAVFFSWWGSFNVAIVPFLFLSGTLAFIMGTYDRIDLTRSAKGKISLSKTWRVCFVPQKTQRLSLGEYESMGTTMLSEREFIDTAILFWLLFCGVLPGVLWYIYVYDSPSYQVALCTGHGTPALILYRGKNEARMRSIAETVSEVCQFPLGLY